MDNPELKTIARNLRDYTPTNAFFSSDYSDLTATDWQEIRTGNGVVIKSDLPVRVKIGKHDAVEDVFDLVITEEVPVIFLQRQLTGTFPDGRVLVFSLYPRNVLHRWQREVLDLPSVMMTGTIVIAGAAATSGTLGFPAMTPDPDVFVSEAIYVHSIYVVQTAVTGAPAAANFRTLSIRDSQAAPQDLFEHYENSLIATDTQIRIVPESYVKAVPSGHVEVFISVAPGVGTDRTFTVRVNGKYR